MLSGTLIRIVGLALLAAVFAAAPAHALTYNVDSTADQGDASPGDQDCRSESEGCTLRAAVEEAAADDNFTENTINVPAGTYEVSSPLRPGFTTHIIGASPRTTVIRQVSVGRVFEIDFSTVDINRVTIADGTADSSNGFFGGNIRGQNSDVTIVESHIAGGSAGSGGGISNVFGTLTVRRSTISANAADIGGGDSGAIHNHGNADQAARLTVDNSTISGNSARLTGGILSGGNSNNSVTITSSTIASNASGDRGRGGGLLVGSGTATVAGSIIALNSSITSGEENCSFDPGAVLTSSGSNLESGSECGFTGPGDLQGTDPLLGPLQDAGGPTDTRPLLSGSPAIDAASAEACPAIDQRGVVRPQGSGCDIGSYERDETPPATTLDFGPAERTNDTTPEFGFSSESGASFECRVYSGAPSGDFIPCNSPYTTATLIDGVYTFEVRAIDVARNVDESPARHGFTVDASPPDTRITSAPGSPTTDTTPSFSFASSESGGSFECSLDGDPFTPCASPFTSPAILAVASHTFQVRASDATGNTDPSPATARFVVGAKRLADLPPPAVGRIANVEPASGTVLVAVPGRAAARGHARASQKGLRFVALREARQIPVGSFLDTRRGTVRLQTAASRRGTRQTSNFSQGLFQILQSRSARAKGLTEVRLKGSSFTRCASPKGKRSQVQASLSRRRIRRLRGSGRGRFRTRGRHSSATVRGTVWTVTDRCDGTLTKVTRGKVAVRDFRRRKTITLRSGKSYLARARR